MLIRLFTLLAAVAPYAFADVEFTSPSAGGTEKGGQILKIAWKESGDSPPISDLQNYQLFLCAGGNEASEYIQLSTLVANGKFSAGNSASGTVSVNIGASTKNAYFLKMISAATGGTVVNYSNRFSLSGMTGVFPASVTAGLANIEGTNGPKTENNDVANGPAADDGDAAKGASVAFTLQTGPTRYAPMKGKPGTTITAKTASRMFPMSSYVIAKSFLPTPIAVTTQTVSATYSVSSMEHTGSPAAHPKDDTQKYLARWRD